MGAYGHYTALDEDIITREFKFDSVLVIVAVILQRCNFLNGLLFSL